MVHAEDDKEERAKTPAIDVKWNDPVRHPAASTTTEDIARAEGEGMLPAPREPLPTLPEVAPKVSRKARRKARP